MDILEYAIQMEKEGELFYQEMATRDGESLLAPVCEALAAEERHHARILEKHRASLPYELDDRPSLSGKAGIFGDGEGGRHAGGNLSVQAAFYQEALEKEVRSITLYRKLLDKADNPREKELFAWLVRQEEHHRDTMDQLAEHLRRGEEWVESPEFGVRDQY